MNLQNLLAQMTNSSNPMQLLMSMLNPTQKQIANQFQNKSKEEQAQQIADFCNQNGIDKEKLQSVINMLNGKK